MKAFSALVVAAALVAGLTTAFAASPVKDSITMEPMDENACKRTEFKTQLVKAACAKGGQKAAKTAMKAWVKGAKAAAKADGMKLNCATCHSKMKEDWPLKDAAMALAGFKKYGGK
jgi:hypothetical protein